jgi:drug/metabolite transporter (DMT)-like permease
MGIVYTTAGKTGFITGLYVIIVPFLGLFTGLHIARSVWVGATLATAGLYLLSVQESLTFAPGDFLVFIGAFLWAIHILVIGRVASKHDVLQLSTIQFAVCGFASLITTSFVETTTIAGLQQATSPIVYSGIFSIGLAFTLQIYAQRHAPETHAAIIFSLESVFAVLAGWLLLNESLTYRELIGCVFMLAGMLVAQLFPSPQRSSP